MKVVIVTGTPGTGKTTIAKRLADRWGFRYVDVNKIIDRENLCEEFDKEKDCKVIDEKKLADKLVELINTSEDDLIIDSHLSHFLPKEEVDLCIITTCDLPELNRRLKTRGYKYKKMKENLLSEVMEVISGECQEAGHNIKFIDTSRDVDLQIDNIKEP